MEKKWMLRCSLHATVPNNVCNTDKDSYIKKHNPLSPSFSFGVPLNLMSSHKMYLRYYLDIKPLYTANFV